MYPIHPVLSMGSGFWVQGSGFQKCGSRNAASGAYALWPEAAFRVPNSITSVLCYLTSVF